MRVAVVMSDRFGRTVVELARRIKTPTAFHIFSPDSGVESVAKEVNAVFKKIGSVEELYVYGELRICDVGIVALNEDSESIVAARILKAVGVPLVFIVINASVNRDLAIKEGLRYVIGLDEYIVGNLLPAMSLDSWVLVRTVEFIDFGVAMYRLWKKGTLGVKIGDLNALLKDRSVKLLVFNKVGRVVVEEDYVLEQGDILILVGKHSELPKYVDLINKALLKYEEIAAGRYSGMFKTMPRTAGG